jgi:hypothetical protein
LAKQNLATLRAGYREVRRVIRYGPSYPWCRYVAPARILKGSSVDTDESGDITVCVLTSRNDWLMCLWSLASFYQFSGLRLPLLIYSDGTLKVRHAERIKNIFPNARIVDPEIADATVVKALAEFPLCRQFRLVQPCARRIIDLPILCRSRSMLMLDSDVLFFQRPEELLRHLSAGRARNFIFERDPQDSYFDSRENIRKSFRVEIASQVNCGIMIADITNFDYARVEAWLANDSIQKKHHWVEQTLWAMYAGEAHTAFLSRAYDVTMSAEIEPNAVMKHYIKPIRDFFYMRGIPFLSRCLQQLSV